MPNVNPWDYLNYLNQHPINRQNKLPGLQNAFPTPQPLAGARQVMRQPAGAGFNTPLPVPNPIPGAPPGTGHGTGVIGPPVKPPDSAPPAPTPGSTPPTTPKPAATQTPQPNKGGVYYPKPTGSASRGAFRPVQFPGVETSGGSWAKYQDGSFVDYASENWKRAAGIQIGDEQQRSLWEALPDSWKVDIASWDPAVRDAYLKALSNPNSGGIFQGQWMTGQQAAEMIAKQQHDMQEQQAQKIQSDRKYQKRVDKAQLQNVGQPRAYFVPR